MEQAALVRPCPIMRITAWIYTFWHEFSKMQIHTYQIHTKHTVRESVGNLHTEQIVEKQWFLFSCNIGQVSSKIIYFHYLKKSILDQVSLKNTYLVLKKGALQSTGTCSYAGGIQLTHAQTRWRQLSTSMLTGDDSGETLLKTYTHNLCEKQQEFPGTRMMTYQRDTSTVCKTVSWAASKDSLESSNLTINVTEFWKVRTIKAISKLMNRGP